MMMNLQSLTVTCTLMIAPITLAACGSSSTSSGAVATSTPPAAAAPSPATASPTQAAAGTAVVATGTATVSGVSKTILTDTSGHTLYYRTPDTASNAGCTGSCAVAWPPLAAPAGTPTSAASIPGTLAVITSGNGPQVTYNGHPLYKFGSTPVGDTSGYGIGGIWYVATPGLT